MSVKSLIARGERSVQLARPRPASAVIAATLLALASFGGIAPSSLGAAEFQADKNFPVNDQARDLFAEGVREYRAGRYTAAAAALTSALALDPSNQMVFQFYQATGDGLLVQMEGRDELADVLKDILRRARIHQKEQRRTPAHIDLMLSKLEKERSEEERVVATYELIAIGPVAVPQLIAKMTDNRQDEMRTAVRIALTRMGYRVVIPLCEVLKASDARLVTSVVTVLADIGDPRALPHLQRLIEKPDLEATTKEVAVNAVAMIAKRAGLVTVGSAKDLYQAEAKRYFRDGDLVRDEMVASEGFVWRWRDQEQDPVKRLVPAQVPRYAWNELVAEQLVFDGLAVAPQQESFQPILAATLAAEITDVQIRQRVAKERTTPARLPEETVEALAERAKALEEQVLRVRLAGPQHLYRAIQEAIAGDRPEVAVFLMRQLQDRWLARADANLPSGELSPDKAGSVLVAALDHPDKIIRYQAAITLAYLDPASVFPGSDKVTRNLADAVGEWGTRVVLVVDQDYRSRNNGRQQLQSKGYAVYAAVDGFEAVQRLEETPIKDAIIISGDLIPTVKDAHGSLSDVPEQSALTLVDQLKKDWRADKTPLFISLPENPEIAAKIQAAFEGKVAGFIRKPFNAVDLQGKIELALKESQVPNANRDAAEEIALQAAIALQKPDPTRTHFDLSVAAAALAKTLDARVDALRIEALKALANAAQGPHGEVVRKHITALTDVYGAQDANLTPAVRAAFITGIGALDPVAEPSVQILLKAVGHEDAQVRATAHEALGHALAVQPELLTRFQVQQRLDVRSAGVAGPAAP